MFFLVIVNKGDDPIAVEASSRDALKLALGRSVALIARTTKTELIEAGWELSGILEAEFMIPAWDHRSGVVGEIFK